MLKFLEVNEFALIEHLEMELQRGLNLLTGETGSGKSIIVDALGLLLGEKGYGEMIRTGAQKASVLGLFEVEADPRVRRRFEESGLDFQAEELIVKRELSVVGKSRAFVNNQLVLAGFLREIGFFLVDIHGQSGEQAFSQEGVQLQFLDSFATAESLLAEVRGLYVRYQEIVQQMNVLRGNEQQRLRQIDLLAFQIQEIEKAQLKCEDEDQKLALERGLLANADKLFQLSNAAYSELYDAEHSASVSIKHACRILDELSRVDPRCQNLAEQLQSVRITADDVALSLREYASTIEANPQRLEWVHNRIAEIERLKRKYGNSVREVLEFLGRSRRDLETLQKADTALAELEAARAGLKQDFWDRAEKLRGARMAAARVLERNIEKELAQLAMAKTRFRISFSGFDPAGSKEESPEVLGGGPDGIDRIEFLISPNPGEDLRPLVKVASGGEMSRIMLALKTVSSIDGQDKTLVFDEVDSGIGGQTADVLGQKLKRLSRRNQVLCVTHLPQIASYADRHYYIEKHLEKGRTLTHVKFLEGRDRIQEIARMISGDRITENVLKHAAELLQTCGGIRK